MHWKRSVVKLADNPEGAASKPVPLMDTLALCHPGGWQGNEIAIKRGAWHEEKNYNNLHYRSHPHHYRDDRCD
jgi:hypothetical protein